MSKHTPAPWVWTGTELERDSPDNGFFPVIELGIVDGRQTLFMTDADRSLIAAAPDLLEALEMMLDMSEMGGFGKAAEDVARAAIAKARGEE